MKYNEFILKVQSAVQEEMGNGYEVKVQKVTKNNGIILDGLSIHKWTANMAPTIYLNTYYEQLGVNMTLAEITADVVSIYHKNPCILNYTADAFAVFDNIKDKVVFKLIQAESNRELLMDIPYVEFLDLAIVFYLLLDENNMGQMTALVQNSHLEVWNISKEELYQLAQVNTPKLLPAKIKTMNEVMREMWKDEFGEQLDMDIMGALFDDVPDKSPLYVLTNKNSTGGASCILYEGCLAEFAQKLNSDILILPSSLQEILLTLDAEDVDYEDLEAMVRHINLEEVPDEGVLSDRIYRYSLGDGKISIVSK